MDIKNIEYVFRTTPKFMLRGFFEHQKDYPDHLQEFSEVVFVLSGHALHSTPLTDREKIGRGDILFIPPNGIHGYYETENLEIFNLLFVANRLPLPLLELYSHPGYKYLFAHDLEFFGQAGRYPRMTLPDEQFMEFEDMLRRFDQVQSFDSPGRNCSILGLFTFILSRLCDQWNAVSDNLVTPPLDTSRMIAYLNENFNHSISLDELAKLTAMSKNTLLRHFKRTFGRSPMEYLLHLRLAAAATLLLNTTLRIGEIAERTGFNDASYFTRIFKKKHGCTPEEYRASGVNSQKT